MVMQQEPNAPNLVYELHRRFGDITFGEPIVRRQTSLSDAGEDLEECDFPVFTGQERIGLYTVQVRAGEIVSKHYQHHGRFIVVRGRLTEQDYQELQRLVEVGDLINARVQMKRIGTPNYVIHDFLNLVWSSRRGREDRYLDDIDFP